VATDAEVVCRRKPHDALRIDDESGANGDAALRVHDPEARSERGADEEQGVPNALEPRMAVSPGEVGILVVGGAAEHDGRAFTELGELRVELEDLRRANEREILGVGVENEPLTGKILRTDDAEFLAWLGARAGHGLELGERSAGNEHVIRHSLMLEYVNKGR